MQMDTSIPLSNLLRPHIQSPAESFGFEQQVKQARFEDQQRQQKMQQDQQMKQIFSNPQYLDNETGGLNTNGIIAGGRVLGPEWSGKVAHQYAQTLGSMSEQKKRLHDIDISNKKQSATWAKTLYEESLADLAAESKSKPMSEAFSTVRQKMVDRINELFSSGEAAQMGLNEEHHQKYLQALPKDYEHLKASQTKVAELEKQLEAMMPGQTQAAPAGPTVNPLSEGKVETTPLSEVEKLSKDREQALPVVKDMQNKVAAATAGDEVPTTTVALKDVAKPQEATKAQTPTQKRAEADKLRQSAVAQDALGNVNNAKKQRDQAKVLVAEADREEHEQRLTDKDKNAVLKVKMNQEPLPADTVARLAAQWRLGDHSVFTGMARNQVAMAQVQTEVTRQMREAGSSPEELNAAKGEFAGLMAGERSMGTRSANIGAAVYEADKFADLALQASNEVGRTGIKVLNDAFLAFERGTGSEAVRALGAATNSFLNAYARAVGGGVMHVADREHAEKMLSDGFSKGDYASAINQLKKEMVAAKESPAAVRKEMRDAFTGKDKIPDPVKPMGAGTQPPKTIKWNDLK